jgi:Tat protein translocase TatB subunit
MFNVGGGELLVILLIALLVLGPDRLPDFARKAGKVMADIRRVSQGFQTEIRQAMDVGDDKPKPPAAPRLVSPPTPGASSTPIPAASDDATPPASAGNDANGDEPASGTSAA